MSKQATREVSSGAVADSEAGISFIGRIGLAGRTVFYAILTAITIRIALLGGAVHHEADANGALTVVSRPVLGKVAIAAVALGFALFGVARLLGAWQDRRVSAPRRWMTAAQGIFYLGLAYVPASFLAGKHQAGSQGQQQRTTAEVLQVPGGRWLLAALGVVLIAVCVVQIRGALSRTFEEGLDLDSAPPAVRIIADAAGVVGIAARALVFLPIGVFLIIAAAQADPRHSVGTDGELLKLSHHSWGTALLAAIAAGLTVFVVFSAMETRYRRVISAR